MTFLFFSLKGSFEFPYSFLLLFGVSHSLVGAHLAGTLTTVTAHRPDGEGALSSVHMRVGLLELTYPWRTLREKLACFFASIFLCQETQCMKLIGGLDSNPSSSNC